ncbi:hypothetical protein Q9K02_09550 [Qipengyuania sp. G39]|uniref:LysR substrate-binding domain-containing protein n=1 Tax=Qipengyuania profundimaris TaxID=3067652 RepID=A0ABT9HQE8_9SPHN|nr:hypothetical protein [Qipengyuania sp. G39]MDP4575378.1 hypothetical protein [Qipengyuania sp. G39]
MLLGFDRKRDHRLLVLMPLFDEASKMRRQVVETMRILDQSGVDCFCPDLPGCNESVRSHAEQRLSGWRDAAASAAAHVQATHVLGVRSGCLVAPGDLPGWAYERVKPSSVLSRLARAEQISVREANQAVTAKELIAEGCEKGVTLAGWPLGADLVNELAASELEKSRPHLPITQEEVGGSPLWLRAEPGFDPAQAKALAAILVERLDLS